MITFTSLTITNYTKKIWGICLMVVEDMNLYRVSNYNG